MQQYYVLLISHKFTLFSQRISDIFSTMTLLFIKPVAVFTPDSFNNCTPIGFSINSAFELFKALHWLEIPFVRNSSILCI